MECQVCKIEVEEDDIICPACGVILEVTTDRVAVIN